MLYRYTYKDWEDGKIIWNDIISHESVESYISESDKDKIIKRQKFIFNKLSKKHLHSLIKGLKLETKSSISNNEIVDSYLETINNLFKGDIDDFSDTLVILYSKDVFDSYSEEISKKQIPPLMIDTFDKNEIQGIRESKKEYFRNKGIWNYSVIETQEITNLMKYVDYQAEVWASAYYDFRTMLLENKGDFKNTASFKLKKDYLRLIRNKLIDSKFIVKINPELFIRMFSGTFLYEEEKITWNKSISSLKYFISELEYFGVDIPQSYGKWDCISNSFKSSNNDNFNIKSESLWKSKKGEILEDDKEKLDKIISFLKRLSRQ